VAGVTFKYQNGDKLGPQFKLQVRKFSEKQTRAIQTAATSVSQDIEQLGRANIRAGGNFGSPRWQQGFRAKVSFQSRVNITIRITHSEKLWVVFEEGRVIRGRPLLWIPLSFSQAGQLKVRARDYPGKLFRVNRPGRAPLLLDDSGPQYFGKEQVRIPRKWHLRDIVKRQARTMNRRYKDAMRNGR
jgi:hypothetical protein